MAAAAASADQLDEGRCLQAALALWRGRAWEGLEDAPAIQGEAARLEEARRVATERLAALLTAGGSAREAVGEDVPSPLMAPAPLPFVGRDTDAVTLRSAVRVSRVVTVTGAGGVGKTRLVAEALPDLAGELGRRVIAVDCKRLSAPEPASRR